MTVPDGLPSRMINIAVRFSSCRLPFSKLVYHTLNMCVENYLGHSVNAPVGRWQKNKDIHWYTRDVESSDASRADREKKEEIRRLKEAEEDALDLALGLPPKQRDGDGDDERSGANAIPVKGAEAAEKEVKRREKE